MMFHATYQCNQTSRHEENNVFIITILCFLFGVLREPAPFNDAQLSCMYLVEIGPEDIRENVVDGRLAMGYEELKMRP